MPKRCESTMSSCRAAPYREPRKPPSTLHSSWRFATMHLKPYPKYQKKDLQLDSSQDDARSLRAIQQGAVRKERGVRQPCSLGGALNSGMASRRPLRAVSESPGSAMGRSAKAPSVNVLSGSLLLLSSVSDSGSSLTIYPGQDGEGPLDIWAVIKPGNTKEKIAIFAAQQCGHGSQAGDPGSAGLRTVSMKIKGCWEVEGSIAKRRKWSADPDGAKGPEQEQQQHAAQRKSRTELSCQDGAVAAAQSGREGEGDVEEGGKTLSVVEMVAYLEQRASDQQVDCSKPCPLRGSGSAPVPKVGPPPPGVPEAPENRAEEEGECVRVLDMVAKLESECLKQQVGGLSRNNSLRRSVGRVLLAGTEGCSAPAHPCPEPPPVPKDGPGKGFDSPAILVPSPRKTASPGPTAPSALSPYRRKWSLEAEGWFGEESSLEVEEVVVRTESEPCIGHRQEPLPGMLFFSQQQLALTPAKEAPPPDPEQEAPGAERPDAATGAPDAEGERAVAAPAPERSPFPLRRLVSHDFLEMRFKIQMLLEPQQYMAFLPHHIMVKIFGLLPTETLAALKCTCHYFKFIIESYGVRPADSRWVCDPRYKDDPCKQCKKRYGRGDVSLCRWHHKPYCQALPYGPGYWMCCHGSHKDTPGCNVGLHDNRWVPAFHSINVPICKKARESEDDL